MSHDQVFLYILIVFTIFSIIFLSALIIKSIVKIIHLRILNREINRINLSLRQGNNELTYIENYL
jgi:hypothetical protein